MKFQQILPKYIRIIEDFDPVILFDEEYARDEAI
jgi:hypothetical protein